MSRSKLMIIALVSVTALLLLSGAVLALGSPDSQQNNGENGVDEAGAAKSAVFQGGDAEAENGKQTRTRNEAEDDLIRVTLCSQEEEGECSGDCDRLRLREMDCDPACDGDGEQNRNNYTDPAGEEQEGGGAGDCDRLRLREMDCDPACDGDGEQNRGNR